MHSPTRLRLPHRGAVPAVVALGFLLILAPLLLLVGSGSMPGSTAWEPLEMQGSVHDTADELLTVVRDAAPSATVLTAVLVVLGWCGARTSASLRPARAVVRRTASHGGRGRHRAPPAP